MVSRDSERQKIHDLREAVRTLELAMIEIKDGYRFDDGYGQEKIAALDRAVQTIKDWLREKIT